VEPVSRPDRRRDAGLLREGAPTPRRGPRRDRTRLDPPHNGAKLLILDRGDARQPRDQFLDERFARRPGRRWRREVAHALPRERAAFAEVSPRPHSARRGGEHVAIALTAMAKELGLPHHRGATGGPASRPRSASDSRRPADRSALGAGAAGAADPTTRWSGGPTTKVRSAVLRHASARRSLHRASAAPGAEPPS